MDMKDSKLRIRNMLLGYIARTGDRLPSPHLLDCWLSTYAEFLYLTNALRTSQSSPQLCTENGSLKRTQDKLNLLEEIMQCKPIQRFQYEQ